MHASALLERLPASALLAVALGALGPTPAFATHFRYGTVTWTADPANTRNVTFNVTTSWRRSFFSPLPNVGSVIDGAAVDLYFCFGDVACSGASGGTPMNLTVTSVDPTQDLFTAVTTLSHGYPFPGTFTAYHEDCCRLSTLANNHDTGFRIWTTVTTASPLDHPPGTGVPPIVTLAAGIPSATFQVIATDIDGDPLTFRLATPPEMCGPANLSNGLCAGVAQPPGLGISPTGLVTFNTLGKAPGQLWTTQIAVTDPRGASTVVDLLIRLVTLTGTAPATRINGSAAPASFLVKPGRSLSFTATGADPDASASVTLAASGVPAGATFSPALPFTDPTPPAQTTFSWTVPVSATPGIVHSLSLISIDDVGLEDFNTASIRVLANQPPTLRCPTSPLVVEAASASGADVGLSVDVDDDGDALTVDWTEVPTDAPLGRASIPAPADPRLGTHTTASLLHPFAIGSYATQLSVADDFGASSGLCPLTVEVTQTEQTITFDPLADRTYGEPAFALVATASSGLDVGFAVVSGPATVSGNALTITGTGTVTVEATQPGDSQYAPAPPVQQSFTVRPASLTVRANDTSRRYGRANPRFTATITGFVPGEDASALGGALTFTTLADASSPAGSYPVTPGGLTSTHYAIAFVEGTLTVNPAPLTVQANDAAKLYGWPNPPFTVTITGFVLGEDASALGGALTFTTPADAASPVGSHPVTPGGLTSTNYAIVFLEGTLTVYPVSLTVQANDAARLYGGPNPPFTATITGFVLGEDASALGGALTFSTRADTGSPVGPYPVMPGGLTSNNYAIAFVHGTLRVSPAALTVTADDKTKTYGQPNPPFTARYAGFVAGDGPGSLGGSLAFATSAGAGSPVGTYAVTPGGLTSTNYTIAFLAGALSVTRAPLMVQANDASREVGEPDPAFTATITGFVAGDSPSSLLGTLALTTPATPLSPPGTYPIVPSGVSSPNYGIAFLNGVLTVKPGLDGHMHGDGHIETGGRHHHFEFRVSRGRQREEGRLEYWVREARRCTGPEDHGDHDGDRDSDYGRDHRGAPSRFESTAVTSVAFSDDPTSSPGRGPQPAADTVRFTGSGRWNGAAGYSFEARAVDRGEPGRGRDQFTLTIRNAVGAIVASVDGRLDGGNIQSKKVGN
jgi:hypothetical protein